jgi:serine/threonine protein kinase
MSYDCKALRDASIDNYFRRISTLGEGGYGYVYKAEPLPSALREIDPDLPPLVAIKEVKIPSASRVQTKLMLINELMFLKHSNLVHGLKFYGCFEGRESLYIITGMVYGKELFDLVVSGELKGDIYSIVYDIALGIKEFHDNGMVHRDIKLENIMVKKNSNKIIIVDYGMICNEESIANGTCPMGYGTLGYIDPLTEANFESLKLADWWAFGQLVAGIFLGRPLFDFDRNIYGWEQLTRLRSPLREVIENLNNPLISQINRPSSNKIIEAIMMTLQAISLDRSKAEAKSRVAKRAKMEADVIDEARDKARIRMKLGAKPGPRFGAAPEISAAEASATSAAAEAEDRAIAKAIAWLAAKDDEVSVKGRARPLAE